MQELFGDYSSVFSAYLATAVLFIVQALWADVSAIRAGHDPGTAVTGGHDDPLFRATRAHANTNENLGFFIIATMAAMAYRVSPDLAGWCAWIFVAGRTIHMAAYYADLRPVRSVGFATGFVALVVLVVQTVRTAL